MEGFREAKTHKLAERASKERLEEVGILPVELLALTVSYITYVSLQS